MFSSSVEEWRDPVVVSMGDPHGIGPEVLLKALASPELEKIHTIIAGDEVYIRWLARSLGLSAVLERVQTVPVDGCPFPPDWGTVSKKAGGFAVRCIRTAVGYCRVNRLPLLVTSPIHKRSAILSGMNRGGHTELLGHLFPGTEPVMAFLSDRFHLLLITTHVALREVPRALSVGDIIRKSRLFVATLGELGLEQPRIAVCGLNPHAGERGLFGDEEGEVVAPAISELQAEFGERTFCGPLSPDAVFRQALEGRFDGVVALYHDQGLAPLKAVAFASAVNITLGLPIIRTSPAHGTAFEIAGQAIANPLSMSLAIRWGIQIAKKRRSTQDIEVP